MIINESDETMLINSVIDLFSGKVEITEKNYLVLYGACVGAVELLSKFENFFPSVKLESELRDKWMQSFSKTQFEIMESK